MDDQIINQEEETAKSGWDQPQEEKESQTEADASTADAVEEKGEAAKAAPVFPAYSSGLNPNKLRIIVKALKACEQNISNVVRLMEKELGVGSTASAALGGVERSVTQVMQAMDVSASKELEINGVRPSDGRVVEGVFDGQNMVGSDGKIYSVPPNYASKSKLVEGDLLKLTITPAGSFIYKQIGPTDRSRIVASLGFDQTVGEYYATHDTRRWNILKASVTYFKGEPDDEVVVLVPKNGPSKWAAVENIIKRVPVI